MKIAEPKVRLLAYTKPTEEINNAIENSRSGFSSTMERLMVALARSTRRTDSIEDIILDEVDVKTNIKQYMAWKHFTVFEFIDFTFEISGISRACSHELVRHRTATYLQQSQRHVDLRGRGVVRPPTIVGEAADLFYEAYEDWSTIYGEMVDSGIPKEDARFIAPNAVETRVIMKIDGRNLLHMLKLRTDKSAMWEIRDVANMMWKEAKVICPNIFSEEHVKDWV